LKCFHIFIILIVAVGVEGSGVIIEIGVAVSNFKVGDKVMFGMSRGAMAEEIVLNENSILPKPKEFSYEEAAAFFVGYTTAYNALVQRGGLKKDEIVLILGAGSGMSLAAIQLAKVLGATVISAASSNEKCEAAKSVGSDFVINYSTQDLKQECEKFTKGKFVDVIYDPVGGEPFEKALRCCGDKCRYLVVGFASGVIPKIPANIVLVKGISVIGVRAGESMRRNFQVAIEMFTALKEFESNGEIKKLKPYIGKVFERKDVQQGYQLLHDRKAIGKKL